MREMSRGSEKRATRETKMNKASSRSHGVFMLRVDRRTQSDTGVSHLQRGTMHIVDLAGSESIKHSGAQGDSAREANNINVSLSALGRVIKEVCRLECSARSAAQRLPLVWSCHRFLYCCVLHTIVRMMTAHATGSAPRSCQTVALIPRNSNFHMWLFVGVTAYTVVLSRMSAALSRM